MFEKVYMDMYVNTYSLQPRFRSFLRFGIAHFKLVFEPVSHRFRI